MNRKEIIKKNYHYWEVPEEELIEIASKRIDALVYHEAATIVQLIYPDNMIGSGLFDAFLIFTINNNGKRIDPPKDFYGNLSCKSKNGKNNKDQKYLLEKMIEVFENKGIKVNDTWYEYINKIKERDGQSELKN